MTAHMSGDERAHWIALDELRTQGKKPDDSAKPAIPHRSRSFRKYGRRR